MLKTVGFNYVYRDPVEAFRGVLDRAMGSGGGRTVSIDNFLAGHEGAARTAEALDAEYKDNPKVSVRFYESAPGGQLNPGTIDLAKKGVYDESVRGQLEAILDKAYENGDISRAVYERSKVGGQPGFIHGGSGQVAEARSEAPEPQFQLQHPAENTRPIAYGKDVKVNVAGEDMFYPARAVVKRSKWPLLISRRLISSALAT